MKLLNISRALLLTICVIFFSIAANAIHIASVLDSTAPVVPDGINAATTGIMTQRIWRDGSAPGTCDTPKGPPSQANIAGNFRYDSYTITPATSGCVTINLHWYGTTATSTGWYQASVYSTFNPADPKANFIADPNNTAFSGDKSVFFSFMATAGVPYTLVVWNPTTDIEGTSYVIELCDSLARPADFDGDGFSDIGVFRPSTGTWYVQQSSDNTVRIFQFGANGDVAVDGDFDGDAISDAAVFRPSAGEWWIHRSSNNTTFALKFGQLGDKPVPGDYDKDGITDIAFFRPSTGYWYLLRSSSNFMNYSAFPFGINGDVPLSSEQK